ncbi:MAG: aldehyde dehydrogenase [Clostridiaceae bacterium]
MQEINSGQVLDLLKEHKEYFHKGETRNVDFRLRQLRKLKEAIKKNEQLVLAALEKDLRKSQFEAHSTEIGFLYESINHFCRNLRKWAKIKKVKTPLINFGAKSYIYPEPYGTVLIIGPFNYPFQLIFEPLIGAIAAGNCAVIKPSEFAPSVAEAAERIIRETFHEEYVRILKGGVETINSLINSPFDYIFFSGSAPVGKIIMEAAAKNLVPVTLELGGKSPCIVDKEANIDIAAQRIAWGKFMNAGQTCIAPDYVLVHNSIKDKLIHKLVEKIETFYGKDQENSGDFGRIIDESHFDMLKGLIDEDKVIYGGRMNREKLFIQPTIMTGLNWENRVMNDEIFGPILPVLEYADIKEVVESINSRPKPLALYLFTENRKIQKKIVEEVSYGGGCINDTMTHLVNPHLPFGGVESSGMGSYHGEKSFNTFTHMKSILEKNVKFDISLIFPPYTENKVKVLKKIMK